MARKTFLVAEPFPYEGVSTRKLVLETAYYNVLTAYNGAELLESVERFPNIDAAVVHNELPGGSSILMARLRKEMGSKPIIFLSSTGHQTEVSADVVLSSHDPQVLLGKIRDYFGPANTQDLVRKPQNG